MKHRALLIGSAICSVLLATVSVHAQELHAVRSITVNGLAKSKVVPDEAHVTVNLNAQNIQLSDAKQTHDEKLQKLMKLVADFHIDKQKVSTQSSNVQPIYAYEQNPKTLANEQVFKGYRVQTVVDIKVEDTSKLAKLMDVVAKAGFEKTPLPEWGNLLSMYYTLSNPDKLHEELLVKAITNAKVKADKMAAAANAKVSRVFQINEAGGFNYQPMPMMLAGAAGKASFDAASAQAVAPPAGEQELQTSVTVTYELE